MASASISRTERHARIRSGRVWARARRQLGRLFDFEDIELSLHAAEPLALGLCPACRWGFVTPVRWEPLDGGSWRIGLRCDACGQPRDTVAGDRLAQRFAAAVTASAADIEQSLHCPEPHCMERWRAAFAEALARDLIEPGDFDMDRRCHG